MQRRSFIKAVGLAAPAMVQPFNASAKPSTVSYDKFTPADKPSADLIILSGTPAGIACAIAAARLGRKSIILERTGHIGGLPANGLGATDIATKGATGGLFMEFVNRIEAHYRSTYGTESPQYKACTKGYHFEPSIAEKTFQDMLGEHSNNITVLLRRQFDPEPENVTKQQAHVRSIKVKNLENGSTEEYKANIFVDASYEGDLIGAAGMRYFLGREGEDAFNEPGAGRVYKTWGGPEGPGSTGQGDNAVQAYNYRMCLTNDPTRRRPIPKPANYNADEYALVAKGVNEVWFAAKEYANARESQRLLWQQQVTFGKMPSYEEIPFILTTALGWISNPVKLPNNKTDSNNQHNVYISTDLPEENWPYPTSGWYWRDRFAKRLKEYTLGLIYFAQNDERLPAFYREEMQQWGLATDEYADNDNFPRQIYVREGRRLDGLHFFTAKDALPVNRDGRPPIHSSSVTASHYALDSHAVRKYEEGKAHLDGFISYPTAPYTVPYGCMVPKENVVNVLAPVPVSGSHIGFSTLRMEPCWIALGQAAGVAAHLAITQQQAVQKLKPADIQKELLAQKATLIYFKDITPDTLGFNQFQRLALAGLITDWNADPEGQISTKDARDWAKALGGKLPKNFKEDSTTRQQLVMAV